MHVQCLLEDNAKHYFAFVLTWTMVRKDRISGSKEESHELSSLQEKQELLIPLLTSSQCTTIYQTLENLKNITTCSMDIVYM